MNQGKFEWTVVIPPNTTATVHLPAGFAQTATIDEEPAGGLVHELGAGRHRIVAG